MVATIFTIIVVYLISWLFMCFFYEVYSKDAMRRGELNPIVARLLVIIAPITMICVAIGLVGWMIWTGIKWFFNPSEDIKR